MVGRSFGQAGLTARDGNSVKDDILKNCSPVAEGKRLSMERKVKNKLQNKISIFGMSALVLSALSAAAQDTLPDEIVVTATGVPTPAAQIGASVDVIKQADISKKNIQLLPDALLGLKGLTFEQEGTTGGVGYLRMRGLDRQNVIVLINGVNVADAADVSGGAEISNLTLSDVEKIEVLRGANSVLYGSNAIAGVINIITKDPGGPGAGEYSISAGSNRLRSANFGYTGETANGKLGYRISLHSMDVSPPSEFDEYRSSFSENEDYENLTGSGSLFAAISDETKFLFNYRAVKSSVDTDGYHPSLYTKLDGHFGTDTDQYLASATLSHELSDRARVEVKQSYFANYRDTFAEIGPTYYYDGKRHVTEVKGTVNLDESAYLHVGGKYQTELLGQTGLPNEEEASIYSLFGVYHAQLGDANFTLGLRQDEHDLFGDHFSWRVGGVFNLSNRLSAWGNVGTGYRAPSLYELYGRDAIYGINGVVGNTSLQPEESLSRDFGIRYAMASLPVEVDIGYFDIDTDDRIFFDGPPPFYIGNYQNDTGTSKTEGVELSVDGSLSDTLSARFSVSKMDPTKADGGVQNSQPRLLWSLNLDHMSRDETVAYGMSARKVQERFRFGVRQEDYETVSLYTKVKLRERLAIVFNGDNVFDNHYQTSEGKSTPRRSFKIQLVSEFGAY